MELLKLGLIVVLLLTNVFCQEMEVENLRESTEEKHKWPDSGVIQDILERMTRNPEPRRYLGLIGRKESAKLQRARKWHKFQTFVGLMGKRSIQEQGAL